MLKPCSSFDRAKCEEQRLTNQRCEKRIKHMINIVHQHLNKHGINSLFILNEIDKNKMMMTISQEINKYKGNKDTQNKCKNDSFKACHSVIRQWWNRCKSIKLGNYLFEPMILLIFKHLALIDHKNETEKIIIFIDIFKCILNEKIKYNERTMLRPLIPQQIYVKSNNFKKFCQVFLFHFSSKVVNEGIKWMGFKPYAQLENDKNRSQKLANSYIDCLEILKNKYVSKTMYIQQKHSQFTQVNAMNMIQYNQNKTMYQWIKELNYDSLSKQEKLASIPSMSLISDTHNNHNNNNNDNDEKCSLSLSNSNDIDSMSYSVNNINNQCIWSETWSFFVPTSINNNNDHQNWRIISNNSTSQKSISGPRSTHKINVKPYNDRINLQLW